METESIQADELYCFVKCLEKNNPSQADEIGEQYTFLAVDRQSKLILAYLTGKRSCENTIAFMLDLRKRVKGTCQITSDSFNAYRPAVRNAFGQNVHFAQQTKLYAHDALMPKMMRRRLNPQDCIGVKNYVRIGNPDRTRITTAHVERTNLSVRLFNRRFTRLTLDYSKTLDNLRHAVALFVAHFDFCRVHSAHGLTPAARAGLTDRTWTIAELLGITT
ncbi:MAG: transposase [Verrucomicrobiota bacterium]